MTTTTPTAIIDLIVSRIEALTPNHAPMERLFREAGSTTDGATPEPQRKSLRRWVRDQGANGMLRVFEIDRVGPWRRLGLEHPQANQIAVELLLTVAYPAKPELFDLRRLRDISAMAEGDSLQIHDEIVSRCLVNAGHVANDVETGRLDTADEDTWFQEFPITAVFFTAQRL
jgi:hypothetical protein